MTYAGPDDVPLAAEYGAQVVHGNAVWPYYPLRREGGRLPQAEDELLRRFVRVCRDHGLKLVLGLPPFPPAALITAHPQWRVHPRDSDDVLRQPARDDDLGSRLACNLGPWGDYLIEVCAELLEDYRFDGFSFDGNYHGPICYCPGCRQAYEADRGRPLPAQVDLAMLPYREYLQWRGERLEQHYARLQQRLKGIAPQSVIMSWTVNAGRYGHFLHSPRAMPTRMNQLLDLPMQEWWLDETNVGASLAPAFGAAYLKAVAGERPAAAEPYLMSRGNPYGTDSFPAHERLTRTLLALTNGCISAESLGWPGHRASTAASFAAVRQRASWLTRCRPLPWAGLLVSEQTRQFYAWQEIAERFLPPLLGTFRAACEEHLPLALLNDWDLVPQRLAEHRVLVLCGAAALSDAQVEAVRQFVAAGGGLVASGESSLCDEWGRPRPDFALADLFGVAFRGRPDAQSERPLLDANFAATLDEAYWRQRVGVATLTWTATPFGPDAALEQLVPTRSVTFRGPLVQVSQPNREEEILSRLTPAGWKHPPLPAIVARTVGRGRVVYLAASLDAALWSYAYPYQRRLLAGAIAWAAAAPPPLEVQAPMCVQTTFFRQSVGSGHRTIIHLFNGLNTAAHHGAPAAEVPLREEVVPIHGMRLRLRGQRPGRIRVQPGDAEPLQHLDGPDTLVELPPLELHYLVVIE
jgi:hypothetical protein